MGINKTEAIILNRWDFRETSMVMQFLTRDFGKISGLLKGARAQVRKFSSSLEPFSLNEIVFYRKRNSSLHLVSQCDLLEGFDDIRASLSKSGMATYMCELLDAVMPVEDKNEDVFSLALFCLRQLKDTNNPYKIMTIFKIKLLSLSGFKPHLDSCVHCHSKILGESRFSLVLGGLLCPKCFNKDLTSRSIFRGTVASIIHIERNSFENSLNLGLNPQIRKELDMVLDEFLDFHLGKELKSPKVLNRLQL